LYFRPLTLVPSAGGMVAVMVLLLIILGDMEARIQRLQRVQDVGKIQGYRLQHDEPLPEPFNREPVPRNEVQIEHIEDLSKSAQTEPLDNYREHGPASYYAFPAGSRTAAVEGPFFQNESTAAHRHLPLGTKVMVENHATGEQVEVKIMDRGPYADPKRRIIDLSKAAADSIGLVEQRVGQVPVVITEEAAKRKKSPDESLVYEVQVGAFEHEDHAQAVLEQVQDWFPKAYIAPRQGSEGPYYRVLIGPFNDKAAAQRSAHGLTRGGYRVFLDELSEEGPNPTLPP
jgi:peptidoglycan lytic transglycosylase